MDSYMEGFVKRCEAAGINAEELVKHADRYGALLGAVPKAMIGGRTMASKLPEWLRKLPGLKTTVFSKANQTAAAAGRMGHESFGKGLTGKQIMDLQSRGHLPGAMEHIKGQALDPDSLYKLEGSADNMKLYHEMLGGKSPSWMRGLKDKLSRGYGLRQDQRGDLSVLRRGMADLKDKHVTDTALKGMYGNSADLALYPWAGSHLQRANRTRTAFRGGHGMGPMARQTVQPNLPGMTAPPGRASLPQGVQGQLLYDHPGQGEFDFNPAIAMRQDYAKAASYRQQGFAAKCAELGIDHSKLAATLDWSTGKTSPLMPSGRNLFSGNPTSALPENSKVTTPASKPIPRGANRQDLMAQSASLNAGVSAVKPQQRGRA